MKTSPQIRLALVFLSSIALLPAQPPNASGGDRSILPAIKQIEPFIEKGMQKTGVPGVAVAIVYRDKVVYLKGFGVRKAGQPARINPDTCFPAGIAIETDSLHDSGQPCRQARGQVG